MGKGELHANHFPPPSIPRRKVIAVQGGFFERRGDYGESIVSEVERVVNNASDCLLHWWGVSCDAVSVSIVGERCRVNIWIRNGEWQQEVRLSVRTSCLSARVITARCETYIKPRARQGWLE